MLYGSELQRALGKNSKTGGVAEDENASTTNTASLTTLKGQILSNNGGGGGDTRKQPLHSTIANKPNVLGESKRYSLNDKSNRSNQLPSLTTHAVNIKDKENHMTVNKHRHLSLSEQDHIQQKRSSLPPQATTTSEKVTKPIATATKAEVDVANEAASKAEELQAFFEDNKRRYKPSASDNKAKQPMQPTPIMPIVVPDRMKARLREKYLHSSKRSHEAMYKRGENLLATLKRQKPSNRGQLNENDDSAQHSQLSQRSTSTIASEESPTLPAALSSSQSSHHKSNRKPTFSALESSNHEATDLTDDQETYDQAKELEQHQEQLAQQNLLNYHHRSRATNDDEYDDDKANDPMLVAEYAEDIFAYLRETEVDTMVDPSYITIQHEVTWRMRDVLIDWVIEVHYMFRLLPETLFLTVNIIDRFLAHRDVSIQKLQLVAIASLFVATKFEETASPPVKQYIYMTGNSVTEEDILKSERYILQILDFKLCYPNPLHFLRKSTMTGNFDIHVRMLAKYFMEITFIDHRFLGTPPSLVAASALWLSLKMLCKGTWSPELVKASGYSVQEVKPVVELILDYLSQPVSDGSFFKKWSSKRMMKVSIFVRDWVIRFYG